jgi:hypothetical protein
LLQLLTSQRPSGAGPGSGSGLWEPVQAWEADFRSRLRLGALSSAVGVALENGLQRADVSIGTAPQRPIPSAARTGGAAPGQAGPRRGKGFPGHCRAAAGPCLRGAAEALSLKGGAALYFVDEMRALGYNRPVNLQAARPSGLVS